MALTDEAQLKVLYGVNGEGTFTFSGHVSTGPGAGMNWHETAHFTGPLAEGSNPKVAFDRFRCF